MVKSKISLWRKGMKNWEACVNGKTDNVSGKNPEDAISKLNAEYPDTVGLDILYILKEAGSGGDDGEMREHICKVCGKPVEFLLVPKGEKGRTCLAAIHAGDEKPYGAEDADLGKFTYKYRDWLRLCLQKDCRLNQKSGQEPARIEPETMSEEVAAPESAAPAVVPDIVQEPVVVVPAAITKLLETEVTPKEKAVIVAGNLPQLDISDCKKNRFAIVGAIVRTLHDVGMEESVVKALRSELISTGPDFNNVVKVSSPYVQLIENGQVLGQEA